jgi:predicted GTPase
MIKREKAAHTGGIRYDEPKFLRSKIPSTCLTNADGGEAIKELKCANDAQMAALAVIREENEALRTQVSKLQEQIAGINERLAALQTADRVKVDKGNSVATHFAYTN